MRSRALWRRDDESNRRAPADEGQVLTQEGLRRPAAQLRGVTSRRAARLTAKAGPLRMFFPYSNREAKKL